jgi:hypothetical protein
VEGFELDVIRGLTTAVPYLSFEFTREFFSDAEACMAYLNGLAEARFNCSLGESLSMMLPAWETAEVLQSTSKADPTPDLWGDVYVRFNEVSAPATLHVRDAS